MEVDTPTLDPLENFLNTESGRNMPAVTRLVASKLVRQETPEQISRALGISIATVDRYIKEIVRSLHYHQSLYAQPSPDPWAGHLTPEQPKREDLMASAAEVVPPGLPSGGEALQRAKVLAYLDSPKAGKLSPDVQKQLRMWAAGASQKEVERKLSVRQGTLSKRIKAVLNEAYRVTSAADQIEKEMQEAQIEAAQEDQRREEALRKAVDSGDRKQINKLLSGYPRPDDAIVRASTGGKTHERWAIDPDDLPAGRKVGPTGAGPDG